MIKGCSIFLVCFILLSTSCKKGASGNNPLLEQYFETNVLTRNFIVSLARDTSNDITANYNGYIFVLLKDDLYHGAMTATKNATVYNGTWSSNSDYSKLIITLPTVPPEFNFLSRSWRFTSKDLPTLKLAPWGSTDPKLLNMLRQ
ncbi:MAG: hypothetical protein M3Z26_17385 [Bacteroidota bacterium]|nr:hypothetical protein [Bacteroidota bacterium]